MLNSGKNIRAVLNGRSLIEQLSIVNTKVVPMDVLFRQVTLHNFNLQGGIHLHFLHCNVFNIYYHSVTG